MAIPRENLVHNSNNRFHRELIVHVLTWGKNRFNHNKKNREKGLGHRLSFFRNSTITQHIRCSHHTKNLIPTSISIQIHPLCRILINNRFVPRHRNLLIRLKALEFRDWSIINLFIHVEWSHLHVMGSHHNRRETESFKA